MEDTVRTLQDQVNAALLGGDWETLTSLVAPDARIIGPKGFIIDRDTWIGVHQESEYDQVRLEAGSDRRPDRAGRPGQRADRADPRRPGRGRRRGCPGLMRRGNLPCGADASGAGYARGCWLIVIFGGWRSVFVT